MHNLTQEQEAVVHHPVGSHARVLAVAGSGKSTTLAHRIAYLIHSYQAPPNQIQVLMFNSLARKQFISHLDKVGVPSNLQPSVHTFHSFSYMVINEAIKASLLSSRTQFWLSEKAEFIWMCLKRVISELEKTKVFAPDSVDPEMAMHAISLWKGSLVPPERAGSFMQPHLPRIYAEFEAFRLSQNALTYDDFIPTALQLLENNPAFYRRYCGNIFHLIVDEYQDINLGQQSLIEMLAGDKADVMVVGDDDQTIYEWRGARPNYILRDFAKVFNGKPMLDYCLSRSFRFGPLISQIAANVIACNTIRVEKPLIAHQADKPGSIQIYTGGRDSNRDLADQVQILIQQDQVPPKEIVVLARMYAQMDNLEAEFLTRHIPYRVDGREPFFKRKEIKALLDYIQLASQLERPLDEVASQCLMNVANKPSRMISRSVMERMLSTARQARLSPSQMLEQVYSTGLSRWQCRPYQDLLEFLLEVQSRLTLADASELLAWMVDRLQYLHFFQRYYGQGETADEKANAVTHFIEFVKGLEVTPLGLLEEIEKLDTTQGKPEEEQIVFTTIFRTKGLEFDYVIVPSCDENLMPYLKGEQMDAYDTRNRMGETSMSCALENERRLFYVAVTRARRCILIGTASTPSRFLQEIQLQPTQKVMLAVEWLASGDQGGQSDLLRSLPIIELYPVLSKNLLEGYLLDLGRSDLAQEIQDQLSVLMPD